LIFNWILRFLIEENKAVITCAAISRSMSSLKRRGVPRGRVLHRFQRKHSVMSTTK
jgi:hypothetical protein